MLIGRIEQRGGVPHHFARWRAPNGTVHHAITTSRIEAILSIAKEAFTLHKHFCGAPTLPKEGIQ